MLQFKRLIALLLALGVIACSSKPDGSQFVGKWEKVNGNVILEFAKNGDSLLFLDGNSKYVATVNADGTLLVSLPMVGGTVFSYSKKTDHIFALGDEFKRLR